MKRTDRLIRYTLLTMAGILVLHVGIGRLYAINEPAPVAQRTSAATLATLHDFSSVAVNGDFSVDVVRDSDYGVTFKPNDATGGTFTAVVRGSVLLLNGFGNVSGSRVRVALPVLTRMSAAGVPELSISGFDGASLVLQLGQVPQVTLRNNSIRQWDIMAAHVDDLEIDRASSKAGKVALTGRATLSITD